MKVGSKDGLLLGAKNQTIPDFKENGAILNLHPVESKGQSDDVSQLQI
jgi:hypothetical protein